MENNDSFYEMNQWRQEGLQFFQQWAEELPTPINMLPAPINEQFLPIIKVLKAYSNKFSTQFRIIQKCRTRESRQPMLKVQSLFALTKLKRSPNRTSLCVGRRGQTKQFTWRRGDKICDQCAIMKPMLNRRNGLRLAE